ncbi:MAG: cupin fold metalloprotein, WbuC family [Elusimicrobia bacterium]|nr:cupin fold metalloprotein, WbuC family [Elusimicrobiota bacterium]
MTTKTPASVVLAGLELRADIRGKSEALYCTALGSAIDMKVVGALKERLRASGAGTVRICLHSEPSAPVHDMIIIHRKGAPCPVHKHLAKEETYQMIEGRMRLDFLKEDGSPDRSLILGEPGTGLPFMARVRANLWHATVPETDFAVFHESRPGPFDGGDSVLLKK